MQTVLIRPIITEKSMAQTEQRLYTFEVASASNKMMIKKAVAEQFHVTVLDVRTLTMQRKSKTRQTGRTRKEIAGRLWKKAVVRISPEQKIDLFEVGSA